jgi:hypothetical protein
MKASDLYVICKRSRETGESIDYDNIYIDAAVARAWTKELAKNDPKSGYIVLSLDTAISEERTNSFEDGRSEERNKDW